MGGGAEELAKLIVWGPFGPQPLVCLLLESFDTSLNLPFAAPALSPQTTARMLRALDETVIQGVPTMGPHSLVLLLFENLNSNFNLPCAVSSPPRPSPACCVRWMRP
jgi:hypothetical protein